MKSVPVIDLDEFTPFVVHTETSDGTSRVIYDHPDFGRWEYRSIDLRFGRITEQRVDFRRAVDVRIKDDSLARNVHHCMCVDGALGTSFEEGIGAELSPSTYHFLRVKGNQYVLSLNKRFHNLHIEVSEDYYKHLLSDSEAWSAALKERLTGADSCIAGAYSLTPAMIRNVYDIFSTPMSGMLKRLVIEARMLELIAMQWGVSMHGTEKRNGTRRDVLPEIKLYLDETFLQEHSLKSICRRFGINEFALKNGFKHQFGTSVFDYLIGRRLDHARELLADANYSIQQVGSMVGYKYANHFSTAFKNRFGVTPRLFAGRAGV